MFQIGQGACESAPFPDAAGQTFSAWLSVRAASDAPRVLVIDDEPSVADALKLILEDEGFSVVVAATGRDGIEQARRADFGVIITDLRLPDMNGLEVMGVFRESGTGGVFILITSYSTPEICARARELGAVGVVPKPFLPSDIISAVATALKTGES